MFKLIKQGKVVFDGIEWVHQSAESKDFIRLVVGPYFRPVLVIVRPILRLVVGPYFRPVSVIVT